MLGPLIPIPRGKKGPPFFDGWQKKPADELEDLYRHYPNPNPALRLDKLIQLRQISPIRSPENKKVVIGTRKARE